MRNIVLGTAGHIDHGKTALVKALTGTDTDIHKEEKKRGITIDIGFAHLRLSSGRTIDIVDAPGHEKFVRNMLRGIFGIDAAMLIIAADDGPMPQTIEHLNILRLLEVKKGLIVITKVDLVDSEYLYMIKEEIGQMVKDTFLNNAPQICFSAKTGEGLEELKLILDKLVSMISLRDTDKVFRLPIDRALSMKGYGTVVTGTIASGKVREGEEVEIYPRRIGSKIRSIQIHQKQVKEVRAGQRVGINLAKVELEKVKRGAVLSEKGGLLPTYIINARLHYLQLNIEPLSNRQRVKFYTGTSETVCRIILTDREKMFPGESAIVQIRLERELVPLTFDKYVIRSLSPISTIGGGIILETLCKKTRSFDAKTRRQLKMLEKRDYETALESLAERSRYRPLGIEEFSQRSGLTRGYARELVEKLIMGRKLVLVGNDRVIHKNNYQKLKNKVLETLNIYSQQNPLAIGLFKGELRSRISSFLDSRVFDRIIHDLCQEKHLEINGSRVGKPHYEVNLLSYQKVFCDKLINIAASNQILPLWRSEIKKLANGMREEEIEKLLRVLAYKGDLVILKDGSVIHITALKKAKDLVRGGLSQQKRLTLSELRDLLGVGRRGTQAIMEYLDELKFTKRIDQFRVLC